MGGKYTFYILLIASVFIAASCRPINIFSPFIDPSKMGNDAKMDAGYNALRDGAYEEAVDYFSDVISDLHSKGKSGGMIAKAYLGRAAAYLNLASVRFCSVVFDVATGRMEVEGTWELMSAVVGEGGDYIVFFHYVTFAADDYNVALENMGVGIDPSLLFEAYQSNMAAATGVGTRKIAAEYNEYPWDGSSREELRREYEDITDDRKFHPYNVRTWDNHDQADNGLRRYVDGTAEEREMMWYLTHACLPLKQIMDDPPFGMSTTRILDMQEVIIEWAYYGLGDVSLGIP